MKTYSIEQTKTKVEVNGRFLRRVLRGNAVFSTLAAAVFILAARPLSEFMGITPPVALIVLGLGLLPFAGFVYAVSKQEAINTRFVKIILVLDVVWVAASFALLLSGLLPLATGGKWLIGLLAEVVAVFAILEFIGLRRLQKES